MTEINPEDLYELLDYKPITFQGRVELEEFFKGLRICNCSMDEIFEFYKRIEIPKVRKLIDEFKSEIGNEGRQMRLRYLNERLCELNSELRERYREYERAMREDSPYIERALIASYIPEIEKEIKKLERKIRFMVHTPNVHKITPEMIEMAKQYPFENLIDVKRGMSLCPFHDDHNPSMGIKNNHFHCFACGEKGDVIKFVMKRNGYSFSEAIKILN